MSNKFVSFFVGLLIIIPMLGFAATDNEQAINTLQAQIQALKQQISNLLESRESPVREAIEVPTSPLYPDSPSVNNQPGDEPPPTSAITFDRDLYYGLRNDSDVSNLQEFLIDQGFLSAGSMSGNFFILTKKAVQQFQSAHGLRPTGYFGPLTRAVANKILAGGGSGGGGGGIIPISQPFYSVEPPGAFIRGQRYDFKAKISNGKPNAQVLLFLERPDGSMKYNGIACLGSTTEKCALYTDAFGSLFTASYELITTEGQNGTWVSWVTVGGVASNKLYHTVISPDRSSGYLTVDPAYMELKIGGSQRIRAIFTPSRPACLDANPPCRVPEQAPYEVNASFSSDNPSIADIVELAIQCVRAPCEGRQVSVRGISTGGAIITASYTDSSGRTHQARTKVNVIGEVPSRQNLPPVISGLKGPTALQVGEKGVWTIQASDPENRSLAYHITWGDEEIGIARPRQSPFSADRIAQTATFTHVYTKAGTFAPLFVVVDEGNLSAQTSASVVVGGGTVGSIKPMVLSDIQKIVSVTPASVANLSFGVREVNAQYNLGAYHQGKWYEGLNPGISDAVWVEFGWSNTPEVDIVLLDQSGREQKIYLPAVGANASNASWYYWIAEDGSSYYAHTSHGPGWANMTRSQALVPEHLARRAGASPQPSPFITVVAPNGGESYTAGQTIPISFKTNLTDTQTSGVTLQLYRGIPGLPGSSFIQYITTKALSVGSFPYNWQIPATLPVGQYTIYTSALVPNMNLKEGGVYDSSDATFSVVAPTQTNIQVFSPNGGETWTKGITQTIKWQDNTTCPIGTNCILALKSYDIKLVSYYPPCTGEICPAYPYIAPYTIANGVYGSSYSWSVGKILNTGDIASDGSYTIQICQTGSAICDSSDSYFKIISGSVGINNSPIINSFPAIPSDIKVGQPISFSWGATDADGDNLSWSASWGDNTGTAGACAYPNSQNKQNWTFTMSHTWQQAGTYPVKVTVDDCKGGSAVHTFNVVVSGSVATGIDFTVENVQLPISAVVDKEVILTFDIINRGNETFFWQKYGQGVQWTVDYLNLGNGYDTVGRIISDGCNTSIELVPGAGCRVSVGYTFKNAGVKTLPITADYVRQVQEINEDNNIAKSAITVGAPIQPFVTVILPNGGETITPGSRYEVRWASTNLSATASVFIEIQKGSNVITRYPTTNDGIENILFPVDLVVGDDYKVNVIYYYSGSNGYIDSSNAPFSIIVPSASPPIILAPNGGESLVIGSLYDVRWRSPIANFNADFSLVFPTFSETYPIYFTTGVTAGDISNQWEVGNLTSGIKLAPGSYYMKVCQRSTTNCDQSDGIFTLSSPSPSPSVTTSVTIAQSSMVQAQNIYSGTYNSILGGLDVTVTGEPVVLSRYSFHMSIGGNGGTPTNITNVNVYNQNNTLLAGPISVSSNGDVIFTDTTVLPVGKTTLFFKGNVGTAFTNGQTIIIAKPSAGESSWIINGQSSGKNITASPSTAIYSNTITTKGMAGAGITNPASNQLANTLAALQAQLNTIAAKMNALR